MMNKKGGIVIQLLVMLVVVLLTSAVILILVERGIIDVRADGNEEPILNTEFIPLEREGVLVMQQFQFCSSVGEDYGCQGEKQQFLQGEEVHFRFVVATSTYNGEVMLVENYRLKSPQGEILLDVDEDNNLHFNAQSPQKNEDIYFKDYFVVNLGSEMGEYTLELVIENPLLNKKVTAVQRFEIIG